MSFNCCNFFSQSFSEIGILNPCMSMYIQIRPNSYSQWNHFINEMWNFTGSEIGLFLKSEVLITFTASAIIWKEKFSFKSVSLNPLVLHYLLKYFHLINAMSLHPALFYSLPGSSIFGLAIFRIKLVLYHATDFFSFSLAWHLTSVLYFKKRKA